MRKQDPIAVRRIAVRTCATALLGVAVLVPHAVRAGEPSEVQRWEDALLERAPLTPAERVEQAQSLLRQQRNERLHRIHGEVLETGWKIWRSASPGELWGGARFVAGEVMDWNDRSSSEEGALAWLEPGLASSDDSELHAMYERLHSREQEALAESRLAAAEEALGEQQFGIARIRLQRALGLQPDMKPALERLAELQEKERDGGGLGSDLSIHEWEVSLSEALLAGEYEAALQMGPPADPAAEFGRAAARLLSGDREGALAAFAQIEGEGGDLGPVASQWVGRPDVDLEGELARAVREYRMKQVLGWIGGSALAEKGSALSALSFRAWKDSLTPVNIALSLPARVLRGWRPDGTKVRHAARSYLDLNPHGVSAEAARAWLDHVGWQDPDASGSASRGFFELPMARTPYTRLGVQPMVVSRRALDSEYLSASMAVRAALESAEAVWLEAQPRGKHLEEESFAILEDREARRLLDQLAFAVEQQHFQSTGASREAALEKLRRLDDALSQGWVLVAEPWVEADAGLWNSMVSTFVDGNPEEVGALSLRRGEDEIYATRTVGAGLSRCPREVLCLDRDAPLGASFYGYLDMDSKVGLGFQSNVSRASFSLGIGETGPSAAVVLPVAHWIGIDRWLPVEAQFKVSADSFYIGPVIRPRPRP